MKKLSIFLTLLAIFSFVGCNSSGDQHNHSHGETDLSNNQSNSTYKNIYKAELKAEPAAIKPNEPVKLIVTVKNEKGETLKDFEIVHEMTMHILIVSEDLAEFYHEHPELQTDGSLALNFTFKNGGRYFLYADYKPKGANQIVDRLPIEIDGNERPKVELKADEKFEKTVENTRIVMNAGGEIESNKELMLDFSVFDAASGELADGIEKYLGESAHFVIISKDLKDFVHAHSMSMDNVKAENQKSDKMMKMPPNSRFAAHVTFPNSGLYKIFVQIKRQDKIITVPFVVNVKQGSAEKTLTNAKIPAGYFKIVVSKDGFSPQEISLSKDKPIKLAFLRTDEENCGNEIVFKDYNIKKKLPVGEIVTVEIDKPKGNEITFACGMDMLQGKIVVQ